MERLTWPLLLVVALLIISMLVLTKPETSHKKESNHVHNSSHLHDVDPKLDCSKKHVHSTLDISSTVKKPSIELVVEKDEVEGWNINIKTNNFRFAPESVNKEVVEGEGHAHLYVDGKKIARLYGPWFHLENLVAGKHEIKVSLNANNHAMLALNNQVITAVYEIEQ